MFVAGTSPAMSDEATSPSLNINPQKQSRCHCKGFWKANRMKGRKGISSFSVLLGTGGVAMMVCRVTGGPHVRTHPDQWL